MSIYSPSFVRKKMVYALESFILPKLSHCSLAHFMAEPPFDFTNIEHRILQRQILPDIATDTRQIFWKWPEQRMLCTQHPFLLYIFDGTLDSRIGLTQKMAHLQPTSQRAGIYAMRLQAPFSLYFPPFAPRGDGLPFSYDASEEEEESNSLSMLLISAFPDKALVSLHVADKNETFGSHPLDIQDGMLLQNLLLYADELRAGERVLAQSALAIMMRRLWRYLKGHRPPLGNSSWPVPEPSNPKPENISATSLEIYNQATEYIQTHLDSAISRDVLAKRLGISAVHINRVFLQVENTTVMRYVTGQRIIAARALLTETKESIEDIAHFVGFSNGASFGTVFRRLTGKSPLSYRRKYRNVQ